MPQPAQSEWNNRAAPIQEDMAFQRASWRAQRVAWVGLALFLLLALLGLFSEGLFSEREARAEGFSVTHQRVLRNDAATSLTITLNGPQTRNEVVLSPSLVRTATIETISPEPLWSETRADGVHLVFAAPPDGDRAVEFGVRPNSAGVYAGSVSLVGGGRVTLNLIVLP